MNLIVFHVSAFSMYKSNSPTGRALVFPDQKIVMRTMACFSLILHGRRLSIVKKKKQFVLVANPRSVSKISLLKQLDYFQVFHL